MLFSPYVTSLLAVMITSLAFKRRYVNSDAFVLEMPPYRFPTLRQMRFRASHEVRHFMRRATSFIIAGVVLVWLFTLIYTPCLSTIATIRAESRSAAFTALTIAWPLGLASAASLVVFQVARHLAA